MRNDSATNTTSKERERSSRGNWNVWLNVNEVAGLRGVKVKTVYGWVSSNAITYVKPSPTVLRFRPSDIAEWLSDKTTRRASTGG